MVDTLPAGWPRVAGARVRSLGAVVLGAGHNFHRRKCPVRPEEASYAEDWHREAKLGHDTLFVEPVLLQRLLLAS